MKDPTGDIARCRTGSKGGVLSGSAGLVEPYTA